jgi:hypothetical protein
MSKNHLAINITTAEDTRNILPERYTFFLLNIGLNLISSTNKCIGKTILLTFFHLKVLSEMYFFDWLAWLHWVKQKFSYFILAI